MDTFSVGLWIVLLVGWVPSSYFVATFRPRMSRFLDGLDVAGLVAVLAIVYARQMVLLALGRDQQRDVARIVIYAALDALLWVRAVRWHRLRQSMGTSGMPRRRTSDVGTLDA